MASIDAPSRIRYVYNEDSSTNEAPRRQGRLLSLHGASNKTSDPSGIVQMDALVYINVAVFLAWKHVQERNGTVIPSLPERLQGCNFDWTMESRDTQFSAAKGVRALIDATTEPVVGSNTTVKEDNHHQDWQFPFAIVGAIYSSVSLPIAMLGQGYAMPLISGTATSAALDYAPYFARTTPRNDAEAIALAHYYTSIGVTHVACLYIRDAWGDSYAASLQSAGEGLGLDVKGFAYDDGDRDSTRSALLQLQQSGIRHVYAILFSWVSLIEEAIDVGVIENTYSWIGAEMIDWTSGTLEYNRSNPKDMQMAVALRGVGAVYLDSGGHDKGNFDTVMREFANNRTLQEQFMQTYGPQDRQIFDGYAFEYVVDFFFQKAAYDATYALSIAACQTPGLFSGSELYETLRNLEFEGATGPVSFETSTGTRVIESVTVRIDNVFWSDERSDGDFVRMDSSKAVSIKHNAVNQLIPWQYNDNTSNVPLSLPPIKHDHNLVSLGGQIFGWMLGGVVAGFSLGLIVWTWYNQKLFVVRAGQPMFLTQLCVGTIIMALAVIPMSMQGAKTSSSLNIACMATPWLIILGFVIAFSALLSKTWRLNQLMNSGMSMRRISVQAKDVIWPFALLITLNVAMLTGWTIISPVQYKRVSGSSVDEFGRTLESYGRCKCPDNKFLFFVVPILLFDFLGISTAIYQTYVARNLPTTLSESKYLALAMASLLETFLLGGPLFFMVLDNPTASYLVGSSLLCIMAMTILLPIFIPKYMNRGMSGTARAGSIVSSRNMSRQPTSRHLRSDSEARSMALEQTVWSNNDSRRGLMLISRTSRDSQNDVTRTMRSTSGHSENGGRISVRRSSLRCSNLNQISEQEEKTPI